MQKGPSMGHHCTRDVIARDQVCLGVGGGHGYCNLSWGGSLAAESGLVTNGSWFLPVRWELEMRVAAQ